MSNKALHPREVAEVLDLIAFKVDRAVEQAVAQDVIPAHSPIVDVMKLVSQLLLETQLEEIQAALDNIAHDG